MKIIIAGAGNLGFHLASLLAKENQDIRLIDTNASILDYANSHLDVLTLKGDVTSLDILKKAEVQKAHLFIAVTTSENTNLLACILAKKLGATKTIARITNSEFLEESQQINFKEVGIDALFSPRLLAAKEIERLIHRCSFTDIFEFENGKLTVIGFTVDNHSKWAGQKLKTLNELTNQSLVRTIAILRNGKTIIPNEEMRIQNSDHIYLAISKTKELDNLNKIIGKTLKQVKRIMIAGDTPLALQTAQVLEEHFSVSLVVEDEEISKQFFERLNHTLIIQGSCSNIELLKEEGLEQMDAFIALTKNSEINIITSLTAENLGVYKTIALVDNSAYTHISQNIGIDTLINKKLVAANEIFRFVRKGKVEFIASFHGVDAEIIEFVIHKNNRVTRLTIQELRLPEGAIIVGVCSQNKVFIPENDFQLCKGDKVIIFALYEVIKAVENIFK